MKRDLQFQKPYQIAKSEKYETFWVPKLLIWRQKWAADVQHGNLPEARQVSPGRILLLCCFEQNMLFLVKLNPEFLSYILVEAKATFPLSLFLLAAKKKKVLSCRFGGTAKF